MSERNEKEPEEELIGEGGKLDVEALCESDPSSVLTRAKFRPFLPFPLSPQKRHSEPFGDGEETPLYPSFRLEYTLCGRE